MSLLSPKHVNILNGYLARKQPFQFSRKVLIAEQDSTCSKSRRQTGQLETSIYLKAVSKSVASELKHVHVNASEAKKLTSVFSSLTRVIRATIENLI